MRAKINADLKTAMKAGEKQRVATLRLINAAIQTAEIETKKELDDAGVLAVMTKMVKQRRIGTLITIIEMTLGTKLSAVEHAALHDALDSCIGATNDRPTLRGVYEQLGLLIGGTADPSSRVAEGAVQPRYVL
ncbi:MAG: GatB/YqeY domain-containing protein, partial [Microbacterium sp.]|nr:GatB/YqeY domain-containing protein [Microbacterium sp.]